MTPGGARTRHEKRVTEKGVAQKGVAQKEVAQKGVAQKRTAQPPKRRSPLRGDFWHAVARRLADVATADVLQRDLAQPVRAYEASPRLRIVAVDTSGDWKTVIPEQSWTHVRRALQREDRGWYAVVDGEFAGWLWVSRVSHRDPWSGIRIWLRPDEAYAYGLLALPQFRSDGVGAVLFATVLRQLQGDGDVRVVYGWVDRDNRPSQLLLRMLFGFTELQQVSYARVLQRWGMQLPRSARPVGGPVSRPRRRFA